VEPVLARTCLAVIGLKIGDDEPLLALREPACRGRLVNYDEERVGAT
jgi:hypothetical protein